MRPAAEVARLANASLLDERLPLERYRVVTAPNDSASLGERPNEANRLRDARAARDGQGLVDVSSDAAARQQRSDAGIVASPPDRLRLSLSGPSISTRVVDSDRRMLLDARASVDDMDGELLLEVADVAELLGLHPNYVRALADEGKLPIVAHTPRRLRLFRREDVEAYRRTRSSAKRKGR
jgi:excisionase family DNA binding protein